MVLWGEENIQKKQREQKACKKTQWKGRKGRRTGRVESKTEMKCKQKPLARANKFRAVN